MNWFKALTLMLAAGFVWAADDTVYVQSVKAQLKSEPKMDAQTVTDLQRGDVLKLIKEQGVWCQVKHKGKDGWISKLFVNKRKPIGQAELMQDAETTVAKTSRRRESSYAVSAATRGLTATMRTREGREQYQSDAKALEKVENFKIETSELTSFQKSAGLIGQ